VILSLQLSFAVVPLVRFTGSKRKMGPFVSPLWAQTLAWLVASLIMVLNSKLVYEETREWIMAAGVWSWAVAAICVPISSGLAILLVWMVFRRETVLGEKAAISAEVIAARAAKTKRRFKRIGVALDAMSTDSAMLAEAVALARTHQADLVLMHVVDGVGGTWYGDQTGDQESRDDEVYLRTLTERLQAELQGQGIPSIEAVLGYGDAATEIVNLARQNQIDLMVLGGHGHRGLFDLMHGVTISGVRHKLDIPIVTVRGS
jgi:manganese transport protein